MTRSHACALVLLTVVSAPDVTRAQTTTAQPAPQLLTLAQAIQYATDHYPTVRAAMEQINAQAAAVAVARSAYLPRLDSFWQSNLATANNIFGQVFPQPALPSISGPVLPSASGQPVWGSATGALLSWEPFDFGLRDATIVGAEAAVTRARAGEALTRLDVQGAVGAAFLGILATERNVDAAQADFARRDVLARIAQTLVTNQLRPGAEASRANAERAAAQTRLIQAQATLALARTTLARVLGVTTGRITIEAANLVEQVPSLVANAVPPTAHPLAQIQQASVDLARAQEDVLAHSDLPRLYVQSSVFARGSGANPNGVLDSGLGGLGLERANWAAGVQIVFPNAFDFTSLRARRAGAAASGRVEAARYEETLLAITSQQQAAAVTVQATQAVAANTPVQLAAAQQSETQARARYEAGLASILEVADAQSLLAQAEVQDQLARVDVWRALLAQGVAQGTLTPFLSLVRQ